MSKKMRRMAAIAMAAAMVVSTPVGATGAGSATGSATDPQTTASTSKVYYKENVTTVVVPTALTVAFNPNNLAVSVDGVEKTGDIVSRPVAIVSEATKDKKVTVSFAVAASDGSGIKFVDSETAANTGTDLNVCLQLVAAQDNSISIGSGTATSGTAIAVNSATSGSDVVYTRSYSAEKLAKATMTPAGSGTSGTVTIKNGTAVGFKLGQAQYEYETINLDSGATNNNKATGTLSGLGTNGYSAFSFDGYLNNNANWYSVNNATITITPTYTIADAASTDAGISGFSGFMGVTTVGSATSADTGTTANTNAAPSIATTSYAAGNSDIVVTVDLGSGTLAATDISSITFVKNGNTNTLADTKYTFEDNKLTFKAEYVSGLTATRAHTITFNDEENTTVVVTLTK